MEERIISISYRHRLSHLSSALTMVPILNHIYKTKRPKDVVILSAGHAGMALYACLEKYEKQNAEELFEKHGIHPHRDPDAGIHVSSGSLGLGVTIAVGWALVDRSRDVHVVLTDGECAEGSVWEALAFAHTYNLKNLKFHVNINGYSAYDKISEMYLVARLKAFFWPVNIWFTQSPNLSFLKDLQAHYHIMNESDKDELLKYYNEKGFCEDAPRGYGKRFANILTYGGLGIRYT